MLAVMFVLPGRQAVWRSSTCTAFLPLCRCRGPHADDVLVYVCLCAQGRGIVLIGGGLRYIFSAWVAVHLIRGSGCQLPIEMW